MPEGAGVGVVLIEAETDAEADCDDETVPLAEGEVLCEPEVDAS